MLLHGSKLYLLLASMCLRPTAAIVDSGDNRPDDVMRMAGYSRPLMRTGTAAKSKHVLAQKEPSKGLPGQDDNTLKSEHKRAMSGPLYPVMMGSLLALSQVAGPDHLCTLINLGAGLDPVGGFKVGASFGAGHSAGMLLVCALIVPLGRMVDLRQWEHYGDYFIGLTMIAVGLYFLISRSNHLEMQIDGTYAVLGCACHPGQQQTSQKGRRKALGRQFCAGYGSGGTARSRKRLPIMPAAATADTSDGDSVPAPPTLEEESVAVPVSLDSKGGLIGLLQGACCPLGLIGAGLVGKMGAHDSLSIALFTISFMLGSVVGTGLFMLVWVFIAKRGLGSFVSLKVIYDICSILTIGLGVGWLGANYFNLLEGHEHSM
jgi:hypothetical protein